MVFKHTHTHTCTHRGPHVPCGKPAVWLSPAPQDGHTSTPCLLGLATYTHPHIFKAEYSLSPNKIFFQNNYFQSI